MVVHDLIKTAPANLALELQTHQKQPLHTSAHLCRDAFRFLLHSHIHLDVEDRVTNVTRFNSRRQPHFDVPHQLICRKSRSKYLESNNHRHHLGFGCFIRLGPGLSARSSTKNYALSPSRTVSSTRSSWVLRPASWFHPPYKKRRLKQHHTVRRGS